MGDLQIAMAEVTRLKTSQVQILRYTENLSTMAAVNSSTRKPETSIDIFFCYRGRGRRKNYLANHGSSVKFISYRMLTPSFNMRKIIVSKSPSINLDRQKYHAKLHLKIAYAAHLFQLHFVEQ